jgi:hypothetical protein
MNEPFPPPCRYHLLDGEGRSVRSVIEVPT